MVGKLKSTFDFAFLQTVFLYRTSVQLKLNPLLSESQTEVTCWQTNTFTSRVPLFSRPGCSTNTSQSCVPLLPNLTDLNPFFPCQDALYHLYTRFLTCRYLCVQQVCAQTQSEKPLYRSWSSTCLLNRPTQVFCVLHIHPQSKEVKKVDSCWHETNVFFVSLPRQDKCVPGSCITGEKVLWCNILPPPTRPAAANLVPGEAITWYMVFDRKRVFNSAWSWIWGFLGICLLPCFSFLTARIQQSYTQLGFQMFKSTYPQRWWSLVRGIAHA